MTIVDWITVVAATLPVAMCLALAVTVAVTELVATRRLRNENARILADWKREVAEARASRRPPPVPPNRLHRG